MGQLQDCRWFKEGAAAHGQNVPCPYGAGSPKAILWQEGNMMADIHAPTPAVVATPVPRAFPGELPEIQVDE